MYGDSLVKEVRRDNLPEIIDYTNKNQSSLFCRNLGEHLPPCPYESWAYPHNMPHVLVAVSGIDVSRSSSLLILNTFNVHLPVIKRTFGLSGAVD